MLAVLGEGVDPSPLAQLRCVADLGPLAAARADRLRMLLDVRADWTRVEAANAYRRVTGNAEAAELVLATHVHELAAGRYLPVRWAAMRYLAEIRPVASDVRRAARTILSSDRRHHYGTGWRAFTDDRELRDLASRLLDEA
ncbi:hypothetical protein ABZ806_14410 [Spirillospora sp. NPDC047418]